MYINFGTKIERFIVPYSMIETVLNEDIHDQIRVLLEFLKQIEKLKNRDIHVLLDKVVSK